MATGMTGMTGTQGPQGAAGGTGLQGPTGIAGPMGRQGGPGPTGVRGATGPLGQGAIFLRAQTIYGSTADTAAAGGGAVRNRTLTTGLPPLVNSGSTTIPYLYMTTTAFINETVTYIVVPAGTYLIRAYATANDGLNSSNIRVDALTSPVGSTVYTELLKGTSADTNTSHICDMYTFSAPTNIVLRQVTNAVGTVTIPLSTLGPNAGITFVKLQ